MKQIALYNDTTDSGTPVAAIVQQQRNGNYEVVMINIAPFYEAVEIFDDEYKACNVAQKRLQEYITRLNERDAVNAEWPNGYPQAEPVDVDMGGDFEGFVEAVNAQPAAQVWYTEPVTSADGETIKARVTYGAGGGGNLIEVLANGVHVWGESETVYGKLPAQARAREMAMDYLRRCNYQRDIEIGGETAAPAGVRYTPTAQLLDSLQNATNLFYTLPVTTADGEQIRGRVTQGKNGAGWLIEVLAGWTAVVDESEWMSADKPLKVALSRADTLKVGYLERLNNERSLEMGDETETVGNPDLTRKHDRMAEIRRKLERLDRERDSLMFELAQLTGE